jgi:hypothetical protein
MGEPCSCSDVSANNRPAVCVRGAWGCPAGYTRFEDCRGVPPGPSCRDGGPSTDGDAQMPDAPDQGQPTTCGTVEAAAPACLKGAPCSCSDQSIDNRPAVCVDGGWQCPEGYTRFDQCLGVPPGPQCKDGGPDAKDGA